MKAKIEINLLSILGFEWQLKIAIDEIKHKEWSHPTGARLENANEKTCSQSEETSDELSF